MRLQDTRLGVLLFGRRPRTPVVEHGGIQRRGRVRWLSAERVLAAAWLGRSTSDPPQAPQPPRRHRLDGLGTFACAAQSERT